MTSGSTKNGMRFAVRQAGSSVGYCALSIKVGTRDEGEFAKGIAHFVEHTLFKGTSKRSASAINNCLECLGGELNAFTTKEEIVLHATTLGKDISRAAALLLEIAFEANFPESEVEVEKGVVLDEIASYKDSPADDIYDVFEEKLFKGSTLSRPILGTSESVSSITSEQLRAFRAKYFTPERMVFTMVSPMSEGRMTAILEKCVAATPAGSIEIGGDTSCKAERTCQSVKAEVFNSSEDKNNHEANCILGGLAPSRQNEEERFATILLCNMLGGPASNSILGADLREKHGWVYNVECAYTPYSDTGVAAIQFGCDKENVSKCLKAVRRHLNAIMEKPLPPARLKAAKRQLLGQNTIALESGEAQCISMGKSLMCYGTILSEREVEQKLNSVSAELVMKMARDIFTDASTLIYL